MHRPLPERPSLDFLKKEAKDLLSTLRQQQADARLAHAQHVLARQYGFASWPRLRRHVERQVPAANPFVGTWKAKVADSTPHPANRFRSATLEFSVRNSVITIAQVLIGESGQEERTRTALHVDGCQHVSDDRPGLGLVANWRGTHAFHVAATHDGKAAGSGTYEVSADGRTLSITTDDMHLVFERELPLPIDRDTAMPASVLRSSRPAAEGGHHG